MNYNLSKLSILVFFVIISCLHSITAGNILQLSSTQGHPNDTVTLTLSMTNSDNVVAMQTMIPMNEQFTFVNGSCVLTSRGANHYVSATVYNDTLRIYSYSLSLSPYTGGSGDLLNFKVVLGKDPGDYEIQLAKSVLSAANGSALNVTTQSGNITILAPKISLSTSAIDYDHIPIFNSYTQQVVVKNIGNEPLLLHGVDFDDNTLNCNDISTLLQPSQQISVPIFYNPIIKGAIQKTAVFHSNANVGDSVLTIIADPFAVNELHLLNAFGETDSIVTISLTINNMDSIIGWQTSIVLPPAITYVDGSFEIKEERSQNHTASAGLLGDTLVLLVTNFANKPIIGNDGIVATFKVQLHGYGSYYLLLQNTILSDTTELNVVSATYNGWVQIYSPYISCLSTLDFENSPVTETISKNITINNIGNAVLLINNLFFSNNDFVLIDTLPISVASGFSKDIEVKFNKTEEGTSNATMYIYSNDPNNELVQVSLNGEKFEQNILKISADKTNSVENAYINIDLDNYSEVTALQFDLQYPYQHYQISNNDILLSERSNNHIVSSSFQNDSTLRILILSMQNNIFNENNGTIANIKLHSIDNEYTNPYPLKINNPIVVRKDGFNCLSSYDSVVYIATEVVHDTTILIQHDTSYITLIDTQYITNIVFDTIYFDVHDTTYIDVPVYIYDTIVENIHDTTYIEIPTFIYDTTYLYTHDTIYIDVPYPIHDTAYITVYDTIIQPITYYNLQIASDDITKGIGVGSGNFPQGCIVEIAAMPKQDYHFVQWSDGNIENPRSVEVNGNLILTAMFSNVGIEDHNQRNYQITTNSGSIIIKNATNCSVKIYDESGKLLKTCDNASSYVCFNIYASGVYFVQIDNYIRKIVVNR